MTEKTRWGILGTGSIARKFAEGLKAVDDAELLAVGSRTADSADRFAESFNIPHRHDSYEKLAGDADVDVIYIATPHTLHADNTILCLEAGKPVLCEKPFTVNASEAQRVIDTAKRKNLFLMEAMWTRFVPAMFKFRELLADGAIGRPRALNAYFGYAVPFDPSSRLFDPALGGGALLDVGIYPVSLSSMIFGAPVRITGAAHLGETGVDEQSAYILQGDAGQLSVLGAATRTRMIQDAVLMGTAGLIRIHGPWWCTRGLTLSRPGKEDEVFGPPFRGNGYNYQAEEVMNCLHAGALESKIMGLDETLTIMKTMDTIRAQWGLKYPTE